MRFSHQVGSMNLCEIEWKQTLSTELCSEVIYLHRVKKIDILVYYMHLIDTLQWWKSDIPLAEQSVEFFF